MSDELVADAQKQAERSSPPVREAARMSIARVQSAADPGQARSTFEMAIEEIRSLPRPDQDFLFEQAQQIAAAFAPDLLREIPSVRGVASDFQSGTLVSILLKHGHIDAAFDYVIEPAPPLRISFLRADFSWPSFSV